MNTFNLHFYASFRILYANYTAEVEINIENVKQVIINAGIKIEQRFELENVSSHSTINVVDEIQFFEFENKDCDLKNVKDRTSKKVQLPTG